MKILRKQYNFQIKGDRYYYYTRRIWFNRFAEKWKFWGAVFRQRARNASAVLEADGYEYPAYGSWK